MKRDSIPCNKQMNDWFVIFPFCFCVFDFFFWFLICQRFFVTSFLQRSQFIVSWESLLFKDPIAVCQSKCIPIAVDQSENHLNEWPKRSNCETILKSDLSGPFFICSLSINQFYQRVVFNGLPDAWIWIWFVVIKIFDFFVDF